MAPRLIWSWMTGLMPPGNLTMRNGDPADLRWRNIIPQGQEHQLAYFEHRKRMLAAEHAEPEFDYSDKFRPDAAFDRPGPFDAYGRKLSRAELDLARRRHLNETLGLTTDDELEALAQEFERNRPTA